MNKQNHYRITIEELTTKEERNLQTLEFEIEDREDIFAIIEKIKQNSKLESQDASRLGLSLRLLGPLMMKNRKSQLFVDFMPHFKSFMQNLKKIMKG